VATALFLAIVLVTSYGDGGQDDQEDQEEEPLTEVAE
jgi:hypothetical protein